MTDRKPLLMDAADFLAARPGENLPPHAFHIGENGSVNTKQLPNFRAMAFHVIGKAPMLTPVIRFDPVGLGPYALGVLIGDAALKLFRPWPEDAGDAWELDPACGTILDIADGLLPLSPAAEGVRCAFVSRIAEFVEIALHRPAQLRAIIGNIDALTNARLTERARQILATGNDPGAADLWIEERPAWALPPCGGRSDGRG